MGRAVLEQGGGVDGQKARVGSRVMGGRSFLVLRETRKCKARAVPQTESLCPAERQKGNLESCWHQEATLCLERLLAT